MLQAMVAQLSLADSRNLNFSLRNKPHHDDLSFIKCQGKWVLCDRTRECAATTQRDNAALHGGHAHRLHETLISDRSTQSKRAMLPDVNVRAATALAAVVCR